MSRTGRKQDYILLPPLAPGAVSEANEEVKGPRSPQGDEADDPLLFEPEGPREQSDRRVNHAGSFLNQMRVKDDEHRDWIDELYFFIGKFLEFI